MKSISILGSSSSAGKSWMATAFCALMRKKGLNVAPFKAQNMSNNAYVTLEGGEIGRAQGAQAEACGLRPVPEMNPVLLKPTGDSISQVVLLGQPGKHIPAKEYQDHCPELWTTVAETLDYWKSRCDVLIQEGAGSPVELNLMSRDIVNLRPIDHVDGRWVLVCDIERGGVFAQAAGTYQLMPQSSQERGIGLIANKFRGDPRLFDGAGQFFRKHTPVPYLGLLPYRPDLQPEQEDNYGLDEREPESGSAAIAWIRLPHISNTSDAEPWQLDKGVHVRWVESPKQLHDARAIVIPGSKNTLGDLEWLNESGLSDGIKAKADQGVPIVGICGGYQMLGEQVSDPKGIAGNKADLQGLGLLPICTTYSTEKTLKQVAMSFEGTEWTGYEIHMGQTEINGPVSEIISPSEASTTNSPALLANKNIWGTYVHGLFESPAVRRKLMQLAGVSHHQEADITWADHKQQIYDQMADMLEEHLDLTSVWQYLDD